MTAVRFDLNLSILLKEYPLLERPRKAAECGFDAVELWWPFDSPVPPAAEVDHFVSAVEAAGVRLVSLNFDAGDMAAGQRGLLSVPAAVQRFRENVPVAVELAGRLGCKVINALYGNRQEGVSPEHQDELAIEHLTMASRAAADVGATVVVEALNAYENPRYPLQRSTDVVDLLRRLGENGVNDVGFLADAYHLERMGESSPAVLKRYARHIAHVQIADVPDRHQPGTGSLPLPDIIAALMEVGYDGYVGLEYKPTDRSESSFDWLEDAYRFITESEERTQTCR